MKDLFDAVAWSSLGRISWFNRDGTKLVLAIQPDSEYQICEHSVDIEEVPSQQYQTIFHCSNTALLDDSAITLSVHPMTRLVHNVVVTTMES